MQSSVGYQKGGGYIRSPPLRFSADENGAV